MRELGEDALLAAYESMRGLPVTGKENCLKALEIGITTFLNALPKPESPYDQAIAYRKLVGME